MGRGAKRGSREGTTIRTIATCTSGGCGGGGAATATTIAGGVEKAQILPPSLRAKKFSASEREIGLPCCSSEKTVAIPGAGGGIVSRGRDTAGGGAGEVAALGLAPRAGGALEVVILHQQLLLGKNSQPGTSARKVGIYTLPWLPALLVRMSFLSKRNMWNRPSERRSKVDRVTGLRISSPLTKTRALSYGMSTTSCVCGSKLISQCSSTSWADRGT